MALKRALGHPPERLVDRSWVSARVSHAKSEMSRCRNQCGSRALYQNLVDTTLRFLIEQVGEVEALTSRRHTGRRLPRAPHGRQRRRSARHRCLSRLAGLGACRARGRVRPGASSDPRDRGCVERAAAPRCRHRFFERGSAARWARAHIGTGRSDDQHAAARCACAARGVARHS